MIYTLEDVINHVIEKGPGATGPLSQYQGLGVRPRHVLCMSNLQSLDRVVNNLVNMVNVVSISVNTPSVVLTPSSHWSISKCLIQTMALLW